MKKLQNTQAHKTQSKLETVGLGYMAETYTKNVLKYYFSAKT